MGDGKFLQVHQNVVLALTDERFHEMHGLYYKVSQLKTEGVRS